MSDEDKGPGPTLADNFKKHGVKYVVYNPLTVIEAARSVLAVCKRNGERDVTTLAVAGMLVWMQAELAGDTLDNTIELMRIFIDNMQRDLKIPRPTA